MENPLHHHAVWGICNSRIFGLSFDKEAPTNHYRNCYTYDSGTTLENPNDCHWADCGLLSSISSKNSYTDMTCNCNSYMFTS